LSSIVIERLLIVGCGSIGQRHLRIARGLLPNADIRILRHRTGEAVPEFANGCMNSMEDALAFVPQAALVANPSTFHIQSAQPLAEAGIHLMVEKPISASLGDVPKLLATCSERRVVLMTAYNLRFQSSLREFRRLIRVGRVGKVMSVRCEVGQHLPSWRPGSDYRQSVSGSRALGGGALLELSHEIDYLRWIFGEVAWVHATICKQSSLEIDVEDTAHLILGFEPDHDGYNLIANLSMDFVRHDPTRQCLAIGEQGTLRWDGITGIVDLYASGTTGWEQLFVSPPHRDESYSLEWQHFLACIAEGCAPQIDGHDGLAALRIIEAARHSAAENIPTRVM
jgi:predicted dehydrogenase